MNRSRTTPHVRIRIGLVALGLFSGLSALTACGASSGSGSGSTNLTAQPAGGPILPVTVNPISNTSTNAIMTIQSVLVENNVDANGKTASDHLEIAIANNGTANLRGFEVFYTFTDPTTAISESYYVKLSDAFTIPAGATRIAHFDNTGAVDHFPVNDYSLYYIDTNALDVDVTVSATGAAVQTVTIQKDAGGAETAD
ncbi:hypothetical protein BH10ACT2_BH10ACT2_15560 [soil metagenome]